ncbi:rod shape-determining protein MreD [Agrilutibacter solisilvae]|uniref:Rod shape-determining protein MreD n=1 Tax=Agrilutibacter solisilvae TaxID=2763317 RepID=A0A975AU01_9GAMM|nr:rod shape-determining protein MreD [Lysobacter solisilvae]QSX79913.1 rod shape-determining protein MreD [Lysobacter solisilvae]
MMRPRSPWVKPLSLLVALLLMLLPMPQALLPLRPYWLALAMAYWVMEDPDHAGMGFAFLIGLAADLVVGSLLGEHALRLVVMTFILQRFRARLRFFPIWQQSLAIGGLLLNDRIVTAALHLTLGVPTSPPLAWAAPVIGMVLWVPVFAILDSLRLGTWRRR